MILVLDSASLYYRSFHALPESMTAPDGYPNNAVRGFLSTITRLVRHHGVPNIVAAWDDDWRPQWRVDLLPSYKLHRVAEDDEAEGESAQPETLGPQAQAISDLLTAGGVPVLGHQGFEADDVVATVARRHPSIVVSGDRDLVQVVSDSVRVHLAINGGMEKWPLLDRQGVIERFDVRADQYVDLAVLRGDPSDGMPGVSGIGAKTAVALLSAFDSIDGVLAAAKAGAGKPMTPRLAKLLLDARDYLSAAQRVATARTDVPIDATVSRPMSSAQASRIARDWGVTKQWDDLVKACDQVEE